MILIYAIGAGNINMNRSSFFFLGFKRYPLFLPDCLMLT